MRAFIWAKNGGQRGWHLVNWNTVIQERTSGGLGIKEMADFNTALLGKAVWSLAHHPEKLWVRVLNHRYLQQSSIMQVQVRTNDSPVWKGIIRARDQLKNGW